MDSIKKNVVLFEIKTYLMFIIIIIITMNLDQRHELIPSKLINS
jgi:hypothetical protein